MCYNHYEVRNRFGDIVPVPCGRCPKCLTRKASAWSHRLMQHERQYSLAFFVTFTYDDENVPYTDSGYHTLRRDDMKQCMKNLRKRSYTKISYFTVGEYGTERNRPHYHTLLFNCDLCHLVGKKLADMAMRYPEIYLDGKFKFYDVPVWGKGYISIGYVEGASVGYCMKYISKPSKIPVNDKDDREQEKAMMSKGIGSNYLTPQMQSWHLQDLCNRMYCTTQQGVKLSMPRYYKDKIYTEEQRDTIRDFQHQKINYDQAKKEQQSNYDLYTQKFINKARHQSAVEAQKTSYKKGRSQDF